MVLAIYLLALSLALSVAANVFLLLKNQHQKSRPQSVELKEFIEDLTQGAGWAVFRIDPNDILMRSPKK